MRLVLTAIEKKSGKRVEVSIRGISRQDAESYLAEEARLHAITPGGLFLEYDDPKLETVEL